MPQALQISPLNAIQPVMNRFRISVTTFCLGLCFLYFSVNINHESAEIAQLGERQTEDLNVPGSIPGFGNILIFFHHA